MRDPDDPHQQDAKDKSAAGRQQTRPVESFPLHEAAAEAYSPRMDEVLMSRARDRLRRLRKVAELAHDPGMIKELRRIADELETDIAKVEAGEAETLTMHLEPPSRS